MVTKLHISSFYLLFSLILAKIHMVTKRKSVGVLSLLCLILAKIHMVTKHKTLDLITFDWSYSSKNPYGNKTIRIIQKS